LESDKEILDISNSEITAEAGASQLEGSALGNAPFRFERPDADA
jgi:hypothetical protein